MAAVVTFAEYKELLKQAKKRTSSINAHFAKTKEALVGVLGLVDLFWGALTPISNEVVPADFGRFSATKEELGEGDKVTEVSFYI
uniref:FH2 domain-containing protein n=1 Tax=Meloidogyne hapla TaxID=6305 RepID=A0A1I8BYD7_MELHA